MFKIKLKTGVLLVNTERVLSIVITRDPEFQWRYSIAFNLASGFTTRVDEANAITPFEVFKAAAMLQGEDWQEVGELIDRGDAASIDLLSEHGLCIDAEHVKELYRAAD